MYGDQAHGSFGPAVRHSSISTCVRSCTARGRAGSPPSGIFGMRRSSRIVYTALPTVLHSLKRCLFFVPSPSIFARCVQVAFPKYAYSPAVRDICQLELSTRTSLLFRRRRPRNVVLGNLSPFMGKASHALCSFGAVLLQPGPCSQ